MFWYRKRSCKQKYKKEKNLKKVNKRYNQNIVRLSIVSYVLECFVVIRTGNMKGNYTYWAGIYMEPFIFLESVKMLPFD